MTRSVVALAALTATLFTAETFAQTPTSEETPAPAPTEPAPIPTATATVAPVAPVATSDIPTADLSGTGRRIPIGGYGEIHYANVNGADAGSQIDLHRFVLFLGHRFDDRLSFFSETEIEHGGEEVEMEFAYLEYGWKRWLSVRGGLLLVPVGIVNTYHEPPTFHGVERTSVDTIIVPTTWREAGVSLFGEPIDGFRYQVAFVNGLNSGGFSGATGIRSGRSAASESAANDGAIVVRLDYSPILGLDLGGSYYEGGAGRQEIDASVSVRLLEADVRFHRWGAWGRAQYARGMIEGAGELNQFLTGGTEPVAPVGEGFEGYYAEVAYDVLSMPRRMLPSLGTLELFPFIRYEHTNTQLDMPDIFVADDRFDRSATTAGLTLRPIPKVVLKADYQWTWTKSVDPDNVWHLGFGYMF